LTGPCHQAGPLIFVSPTQEIGSNGDFKTGVALHFMGNSFLTTVTVINLLKSSRKDFGKRETPSSAAAKRVDRFALVSYKPFTVKEFPWHEVPSHEMDITISTKNWRI
jgi:hypothetical protein